MLQLSAFPPQPLGPNSFAEADDRRPRMSFWQRPWVQLALPITTSLSLHAAVIVLGLLTLTAYKAIIKAPHEEQLIIPDSTLVEQGPPGGVPNVGQGDPFRAGGPEAIAVDAAPAAFSATKGLDVSRAAAAATLGGEDAAPIIGVGPSGGIQSLHKGPSGGPGEAGGQVPNIGIAGGAAGLRGPVFGDPGGNVTRVAFLCDASGSMMQKMPVLERELAKAVDGLKPVQAFNVIFFQGSEPFAFNRHALIQATPVNKRSVGKFLEEVTPAGSSDPLPGLKLAFGQKPQLIYLLTDGDFPDNNQVLRQINELNKEHKVKINTVAFVSKADTDVDFIALLRKVAADSGGTFRKVLADDL